MGPKSKTLKITAVVCGLVPLLVVACSAGADSLTVDELLGSETDETIVVKGDLIAYELEMFGEDTIETGFDVELCQSLEVSSDDDFEEVECVGESLSLPDEVGFLDLGWDYADFTQYLRGAEVSGRLVDGDFLVDSVNGRELGGDSETTTSGTATTQPPTSGTPSTEAPTTDPATTDVSNTDAPLPIDELPGEDLVGLRTYVRSTEIVYLAQEDFVSRVRQLRANCESADRLQEILDNLSGRGPEAPQDYVDQHDYVCPDSVAGLDVVEGVELGS